MVTFQEISKAWDVGSGEEHLSSMLKALDLVPISTQTHSACSESSWKTCSELVAVAAANHHLSLGFGNKGPAQMEGQICSWQELVY